MEIRIERITIKNYSMFDDMVAYIKFICRG